ncbi:MAG: Uma2 family endonuclease [Janthinobacterium lividum]
MAIAEPKIDIPGITRPMSYEEYMSGPEEMARYDILDGWKVYRLYGEKQLANPTRDHQRLQGNLYSLLRLFAQKTKQAEALMSPCDVRISLRPLRSRQPDILLISQYRLAQNPPPDDPAPLSPAPELVVEIISPSDTASVLAAKIRDYQSVEVQEIWILRSKAQTVEVRRLTAGATETIGIYGLSETAQSMTFPGLSVPVSDIFSLE